MTRTRLAIHWLSTLIVALLLAATGVPLLLHTAHMQEGMGALGYPPYMMDMLGLAKVLAVVALLAPGFGRLKEWAYAGTVFVFLGAAWSHAALGDPALKVVVPLVLTLLALVSWRTRPASRVVEAPAKESAKSLYWSRGFRELHEKGTSRSLWQSSQWTRTKPRRRPPQTAADRRSAETLVRQRRLGLPFVGSIPLEERLELERQHSMQHRGLGAASLVDRSASEATKQHLFGHHPVRHRGSSKERRQHGTPAPPRSGPTGQ